MRYIDVRNSKSLNGNTSRAFKKVGSSPGDEDVVKNLGKVISTGLINFGPKDARSTRPKN